MSIPVMMKIMVILIIILVVQWCLYCNPKSGKNFDLNLMKYYKYSDKTREFINSNDESDVSG